MTTASSKSSRVWGSFYNEKLRKATRHVTYETALEWLDEFLADIAETPDGRFTADDLRECLKARLEFSRPRASDWAPIDRQLHAFVAALLDEYAANGAVRLVAAEPGSNAHPDTPTFELL